VVGGFIMAGCEPGWVILGVVQGCGHGVLYGRPSARAKIGIQKPVQISVFSALPDLGGVSKRGWCNIWAFSRFGIPATEWLEVWVV